jgi:hypothetical protein
MKKTTKSAFIFLLSISTLLIGFGAVSTTSAQEISTENVLLQKLDALVEQLANLARNTQTSSTETTGIQMQYASGVSNPTCLDNYQSWPNSLVRKTGVAWDPTNLPVPEYPHYTQIHRSFLDLNGDGLVDYIHHDGKHSLYSGQYNYNNIKSCVMLNNGSGWDTAFRCVSQVSGSTGNYNIRYYGDCADI